jgi:hypothetical protein
MKQIMFFLLASTIVANAIAQDKIISDANAQQRTVSSFHGIKIRNGISLIIKQGNEDGVVVSASEDKYRDRIKTEVVDGILKIYYDVNLLKDLQKTNKHLRAYVSVKKLDKLHASEGASVQIESTLTTSNLDLDFASGAKFEGRIEAASVTLDQSSGAHCRISGKAESLDIDADSGAHFYGYGFSTAKCNASASTGSKVEITVEKELSADAHSGGDISYKGGGNVIKITTNAGGRVKKLG